MKTVLLRVRSTDSGLSLFPMLRHSMSSDFILSAVVKIAPGAAFSLREQVWTPVQAVENFTGDSAE